MKPAAIVTASHTAVFLSGPPGTGKTSLAIRRLYRLLESGVAAEQILVLVPHRALAVPYYEAISSPRFPAGGQVDLATIGGLAHRTIDLFWPLIARPAGFAQPTLRPRFLTLETAQYYMGRIVQPYLESGAFEGITISRARLISQIIDNLNKSAAVGFPLGEISTRLARAWAGESARRRIFDQVQAVASDFRSLCLTEGVLDWSLQIQLFTQHLLPTPQLRRYLLGGYRHLIVDNVEEDIPATHDLLRVWLPIAESALVVYDEDGGHRVFLGADPSGALALAQLCRERVTLQRSHVASPGVAVLGKQLSGLPGRGKASSRQSRQALVLPRESIRFHPQMLDWVASEVSRLVSVQGLPPAEIALLAPFVSDGLRFSIEERLARYGVPLQTHRPSRQLREEPAVRCLLTLSKLAHPTWGLVPPPEDVAQALTQAIADMDPVRASLLVSRVYRRIDGKPTLIRFSQIGSAMQERISFVLGGRYAELLQWIEKYATLSEDASHTRPEVADHREPLDYFLGRLFGEVLTQPGFGFRHSLTAGAAAAMLIESVRKFRLALPEPPLGSNRRPDLGQEYVALAEQGVVAAQYISSWQVRPVDAVLLVPAYTFLMLNRPVRVQFWIDAGSAAWHERIFQPLTHPYTLQRGWPPDAVWSDDDEVRTRDEALARLVLGLSRRCRERVFLAYCELNERGYEQQGPILRAVQRLLRLQDEAHT